MSVISLVTLGLDVFDYVSDIIVLTHIYDIATTLENNGSYMAFTIIYFLS